MKINYHKLIMTYKINFLYKMFQQEENLVIFVSKGKG